MPDPKHAMKPSERKRLRTVLTVWYLAVLITAGVGSYGGLTHLGLTRELALVIVGALELGAIVFTMIADHRRRLGEEAWAARLMAAAVASFAIWVNWAGHSGFWKLLFAGMSVAGYVVVQLDAGMKRRDRRYDETGELPIPPPEFTVLQWATSPLLIRLAREVGVQKRLSARNAVAAARRELRARRRRKAITKVCRQHLAKVFGPAMAELVLVVSDGDQLAAEVERLIDWPSFAKAIAARVDPAEFDRALARAERDRRAKQKTTDQAAVVGSTTDRPTTPTSRPTTRSTNARGTRPTARSGRSTTPAAVGRAGPTSGTDHKPTDHPTTAPTDHSPAAVTNAREIRGLYPAGLPEGTSDRQVREQLGWSHDRARSALAAYRSGADLVAPTTADQPTNGHRPTGPTTPVMVDAN
jgi:hypothetical protein